MLLLLKIFARTLACLPEAFVACLCRFFGWLVELFMPRRSRSTMNSLSHAFPDKTEQWRKTVFRRSAVHLFEMGLFRPASAYFSQKRLEACLEIAPEAREIIKKYEEGGAKHGQPVVIMLPHMTMSEAATMLPARAPGLKPVHVIFRPLNQPSISRWVTREREKFGANLISRRKGYNDAMAALRRGEILAVLFDQDASKKGSTITFMDRIVSATDLPALMAHRFGADVFLMLLERQGFWKAKLTLQQLPLGDSPAETTVHAHDALEAYLQRDTNTAADWLWLHDRWDHFYSSYKRFSFPEKRNEIALSNRLHGYDKLPRKVRFWVRLPNWLGDVVMALPVLRAIREARPDFEFTLIGKAGFEPLVDRLGVADHFIPLPKRGSGYFCAFYRMRKMYPDTYYILTNSFRGDLEAYLTSCAQRFGMVRPGKRRPLLTNAYHLSEDIDERQLHQTSVWEGMARKYGLKGAIDYSPVKQTKIEKCPGRVGLICGTENSPEKRWPVEHWRSLITGLLEVDQVSEVVLYGTPADRTITDQVAAGFDPERVWNLAGETDLAQFCDELSGCELVCCNDTGGMHLANMLGTPVVAIFGPTNPVRTGPIFSTPHRILQPDGCPATGGVPIREVSPQSCLQAALEVLSTNGR
ncbi:glycosyltransferase family 9 protein [Coraliomargarita sinensis]|uniref:LpxL/LpxP family acyltransferase n=1 Tax=Coraliomargarita sinensis TaxID=2174842 RepID=UPI001304A007|nr:glycosyltransferase family 9 protein [Coraliomargarita sinensis]